MSRRCTRWLFGVLLMSGLSGCPGSLDDPSRFGVGNDGGLIQCSDPTSVVTNLFETRCGGASCHGAGSATIDLVSEGVEGRLVDQESTACAGQLFVSSSNPGRSYLLNKVTDDATCGSVMPIGRAALSPVEFACLQNWVGSIVSGGSPPSMDAGASPMDSGAGDAEAGGI